MMFCDVIGGIANGALPVLRVLHSCCIHISPSPHTAKLLLKATHIYLQCIRKGQRCWFSHIALKLCVISQVIFVIIFEGMFVLMACYDWCVFQHGWFPCVQAQRGCEEHGHRHHMHRIVENNQRQWCVLNEVNASKSLYISKSEFNSII